MPAVSTTPELAETKRRLRAVQVAIAASALVCAIEMALGWALGLRSLFAEGVHSLLDGLDSVIVLFAVIAAARPADRSHQFGHGKFEAVGAAIEGTFVLLAGIGIGWDAINRLIHGGAPDSIPLYVCVVMVATSGFYLIVSAFLTREAEATKSPAIRAEALHLRSHIYITAGVAGGLLLGSLGDWPIADTVLAVAIACCLLGLAVRIFRDVWAQITDAALPSEEIDAMADALAPFKDRFVEIHALRTRQSGAEPHIEMHLVVRPETSVAEAHNLCDGIEQAITEHRPTARVTIHIEPPDARHAEFVTWIRGNAGSS
ncbi:MAG: cation diffusion facilitator family transporter [Planctomycetota bacterium]